MENRDAHRTLEFVNRLTKKLEADREHYSQVFARVDRASMRRWALLYLSEHELSDLRENLRDHTSSIAQLSKSPRLDVLFHRGQR